MKTVTIQASERLECDMQEWNAYYVVDGKGIPAPDAVPLSQHLARDMDVF